MAFLSFLLNNGIVPALFEERVDINRKIYDFSTNKGDFRVYVKCTQSSSSENKKKTVIYGLFHLLKVRLMK